MPTTTRFSTEFQFMETETELRLAAIKTALDAAGLTVERTPVYNNTSELRVRIGTVHVDPHTGEQRPGEGPWMERYEVREALDVPLWWYPLRRYSQVAFSFDAVSVWRDTTAYFGGVALNGASDDTREVTTHCGAGKDEYIAFRELADGKISGRPVTFASEALSFREAAYRHDRTVTRYVMDVA